MSLRDRCKESSKDGWQGQAAHELKRVCDELDAAARQARSDGKREDDNELVILAEEVIDLATRGLVATIRVTATAAQAEAKEAPNHPASERLDLTRLMAREEPDSSTTGWPVDTVARLQASVAPMAEAIRILTPHTKESVDDLTLLREEVMDVAARLLVADARVGGASSDGAETEHVATSSEASPR